ncbi:MAG TPA: glucoamylase family protein, partial [Acidobacteriaceae bacterium]|nr:glucoamylase family protein [Acidobacteriaceae bacterium]
YGTMARLPFFKGHLYNWYTTDTLEPLRPITVSSVDSGNFVASLYTVKTGTLALLKRPLLESRLFAGVDTHLRLLQTLRDVPQRIAALKAPADSVESPAWLPWVLSPETLSVFADLPPYTEPSLDEPLWWTNETKARIERIATLVNDYLPWLKPKYAPIEGLLFEKPAGDAALHAVVQAAAASGGLAALPTLEESPAFVAALEQRLAAPRRMPESAEAAALIEALRIDLARARERLTRLMASVQSAAAEAGRLADNTDFAFLVNKDRLLLSIGYEFSTNKIHWACYDMLASEARIATYIAVARGELSQQGWFKMSRVHTQAYGNSVLLSWTGTMFEYLMPALWMRSYPDTLLSNSLHGAVAIQRAYAKEHNIPWGISESGYAAKTDQGHYHYQAFGIPQIALKWDATAGPVVSPYSTFLALNVEPAASIQNLRRMAAENWTGAYGFYEAVDYTGKQPEVVREWMAHHQGMCILGLLNLLEDNAVQRWFYDNTQMRAVELLLHEKPMRETTAKSEAPAPSKKAKKPAALKKAG